MITPQLETISTPSDAHLASAGRAARPHALAFGRRELIVGIAVLVLAVSTDRFGIELGGLNLRIELIAGGLLALWCLVRLIRQPAQVLQGAGVVEACLIGWLGMGLLSSLVFSPARGESLRLTIIVAGLLLQYGVGFVLLRSPRAIRWAALAWVVTGTGVAAIGLLSALLFIFFRSTFGITLAFEGDYNPGIFTLTSRVHSTLWEPNIFGSYLLTVLALSCMLSITPGFRSTAWQRFFRASIGVTSCGIVLSMTRTAWIVGLLLVGVICAVCLVRRLLPLRQLARQLALPVVVGATVGFLLGFSMPSLTWSAENPQSLTLTPQHIEQMLTQAVMSGVPINGTQASQGSTISERLQGMAAPDTATSVSGRKEIYQLAMQKWLERPVLGWGTGSYLYVAGPYWGGWLPNVALHILLDTGLVGFIILAIAFGSATWQGIRALTPPVSDWNTTHYILLGLLIGALGLFVAYQLTDGTWLGFTWVLFAMLVAAGRYATVPDIGC